MTKSFGCEDEDVQELCIQCLKDLACQYYDYLNLYFDSVCAVIGLAM